MAVKDIYQAVIQFNLKQVAELVQTELDAGTDIEAILNDGLIAPMDEVGQKFSEGDLFVPEMLRAAQTMKGGLEILRPHLSGADAKPRGIIVIGSVKGDLHDIGKNLVSMMMEGAGFKLVDIGVDVDPNGFLKAAEENQADIVGLSALLTTTMPAMEATVALLKKEAPGIRTIVGGAPVSRKFADQIGADGFSDDAPGAVIIARELLSV